MLFCSGHWRLFRFPRVPSTTVMVVEGTPMIFMAAPSTVAVLRIVTAHSIATARGMERACSGVAKVTLRRAPRRAPKMAEILGETRTLARAPAQQALARAARVAPAAAALLAARRARTPAAQARLVARARPVEMHPEARPLGARAPLPEAWPAVTIASAA